MCKEFFCLSPIIETKCFEPFPDFHIRHIGVRCVSNPHPGLAFGLERQPCNYSNWKLKTFSSVDSHDLDGIIVILRQNRFD